MGHLVLAIICKSNGQEGNCVDAYTFRSDATAKGTKGHNKGASSPLLADGCGWRCSAEMSEGTLRKCPRQKCREVKGQNGQLRQTSSDYA